MKKIITIIIILFALALLSCCGKTTVFQDKVSQLRRDLFYSESEYFKIYAYPETRESPLKDDGFVGKTENFMIFKLSFPAGVSYSVMPSIKFNVCGEEYYSKFDYDTTSTFNRVEIAVTALPTENFYGTLSFDKGDFDIEFSSLKRSYVISDEDAVKLAASGDVKKIKDFLSSNADYEIRVRLLDSEGYNYWSVSFISETGGVAALYDAETGEVIAIKNLTER